MTVRRQRLRPAQPGAGDFRLGVSIPAAAPPCVPAEPCPPSGGSCYQSVNFVWDGEPPFTIGISHSTVGTGSGATYTFIARNSDGTDFSPPEGLEWSINVNLVNYAPGEEPSPPDPIVDQVAVASFTIQLPDEYQSSTGRILIEPVGICADDTIVAHIPLTIALRYDPV